MAGDSINEILMRAAWKRLWEPGTPYYLPTVIVDGAKGDGITVNPLGGLEIPQLEFPLFDKEPWGSVKISLDSSTLTGLNTLAQGAMTYDESAKSFTAKMTVGKLEFSGGYTATTGGVAGCAIDGAAGLLNLLAPESVDASGAPSDLELATEYREKLVQEPNGLQLVSTYYDHNESLSEIVNEDSVFQEAWTTAKPFGYTTAYFARQTATAAANPEDKGATVGDETYRHHAGYMRFILLKRAEKKWKATKEERWLNLMQAVAKFQGNTDDYQGQRTVGEVMDHVANPGAHQEAQTGDASELPEAIGERRAEEDLPQLEELARSRETGEQPQVIPGVEIKGGFTDEASNVGITVEGTVAIAGTSPNTYPVVTLTKISLDIPDIHITLSGDDGSGLRTAIENAIASTSFVKDLLKKEVAAKLGSSEVLTYLNERINQAITKALG